MNVWITLLRGINVGGHNKLPMKDFRALLTSLGHEDVATYIQSGNAVFRSGASDAGALASTIRGAIDAAFDFAPDVLVISMQDLTAAMQNNPYADSEPDHKALHVSFLADEPASPDLETMQRLATQGENFSLDSRVFYLHAPNGIGRSKLAARVERLLGVSATSRNWRTVGRLYEMANKLAD